MSFLSATGVPVQHALAIFFAAPVHAQLAHLTLQNISIINIYFYNVK